MKSLYESILDSDEKITKGVKEVPLDIIEDFLRESKYAKFCTFERTNDRLLVHGPKRYAEFNKFRFMSTSEHILLLDKLDTFIELDFFSKHVSFDKCDIKIIYAQVIPQFLSRCNNCIINITNSFENYNGLDKVLKETKNNMIVLNSKKVNDTIYDFSLVNGMNLSNCDVEFYQSAKLDNIKNFSAKSLTLQPYSVWSDLDTRFSAENMKQLQSCIDSFLKRNNVQSFGWIDSFVQYIDWVMKVDGEYKLKVQKATLKRIPKLK